MSVHSCRFTRGGRRGESSSHIHEAATDQSRSILRPFVVVVIEENAGVVERAHRGCRQREPNSLTSSAHSFTSNLVVIFSSSLDDSITLSLLPPPPHNRPFIPKDLMFIVLLIHIIDYSIIYSLIHPFFPDSLPI